MSSRPEQRQEEQALFQTFLEARGDFAGEEIREWSSPENDPPDVICVTASGKRVGVEICQWAHFGEIKAGKLRERIEGTLLDAIGTPQPINTSKNFWLVVFFPKTKVLNQSESVAFRESLFRLIEHVDQAWSTRLWGRDYRFGELDRFPPLDKYFESVRFAPGHDVLDNWIVPVRPAGSFDNRTMVDPLLAQLRKKALQCRVLKTPCNEVHLVIAYDQAHGYCSPINTPRHRISDTAKEAVAAFARIRHPFTRAFLFIALDPGPKVHRIL